MEKGDNALKSQHTTLINTKNCLSNIKSNAIESKEEISQFIDNLNTVSEVKDSLENKLNTITTLSTKHTSLCKEISTEIEKQTNSIDTLNDNINLLNKELI